MGKLSHTSRLASLYRYVQGVPLAGELTAPAAASATVAALLLALIGRVPPALFPAVAAGFYGVLLLNRWLARLGMGLLNLRRLNGVLLLDSAILSIGSLLAAPLPPPASGAVASASAAIASTLRFAVMGALAGRSRGRGFAAASAATLLEAAPIILLSGSSAVRLGLAAGFLAGSTASILLTGLLLDKLYRIRGLKPMSLLSGMLAVFLDGRKEWLEELAETLEDEAEIEVELILLREHGASKPSIALVIPDFHPGPFRNFGSSALPYMIAERLKALGVEAVILRGLSTHNKNIISARDCERIADAVAEAAARFDGGYKPRAGAPRALKVGDAKGTLVPLGDGGLLLMTLHPRGMEDIPPTVADGFAGRRIIPVDAHNSFSDEVKDLDGERLWELRELVRAASEAEVNPSEPLLAGYGWAGVDGYGAEDGIGPLGVSALVLGSERALTALIVLDGNNALPEVRSRILERLKPLGFAAAEALTTDTHIVNGVKLGGRGYHPLGEVVPAELLAERAYRAASKALSNLKPMEARRLRLRFKGVKVMSEGFLAEASEKTFQCLRLFAYSLAAAPAASATITLLLA